MKKRQYPPGIAASIPPVEMSHAELLARQVELEIQNEALLQARSLLEASRDRYVDFYDFSPVGYITLSHKALITEINLTGAAMLGEARSQLRSRRFAEFLAVEDNDFWHRHFMAARQHEEKMSCELRLLRGDGSRIYVQIDSLCLAKDGREPVVRLALTDITERKRAEAALRESEEQRRLLEHQKIIQTSLDGFWVARVPDARILEANEAFCNMVGYSREELLAMSVYDLEAAESPAETAAHIKRVVEVGYDRFETRHRHKLGHLIDLEVSVSHSGSDGGVNFVFVRDITERKQAEKELRASEQKFRSLAENLPDILIRYDRSGQRTYVNPVMGQIFSVTGKETLGQTPQEANPLRLPEKYHSALKHTLATGERSEFEMELSIPSGDVGVGFVTIAAERDADGQVSGAIAIGRDISKRKQTELQLRELTAHLHSVREEELARLAREIHDDLGSTLAALNLKISLLLDFELPEEMKNTSLSARLESLPPLIDNAVAAMRRIISGMRPDVLDNLGLFAALKWQAEQFGQHSGIECQIVCVRDHDCRDCKNCEYELGEKQAINLFRIFQEALTNVARHSGATLVKAEFRPGREEIVLSVSDNGCGLPEGKVFSPTSYGMRGMRERVGQMGGRIAFEKPDGGGLRVAVRLPQSAQRGSVDNSGGMS